MNICQVCCTEYKPTRFNQKYCGRACYYKSKIGHESYVPKATITKICKVCNKEFLTGGRLGKSNQIYCSVECMYTSRYKSTIKPKTLSDCDAAYLAGILDGEGNISLLRKTGRNPRIRIQIANTDKNLIDWIICTTGVGNINTRPGTDKHKTAYAWVCNNQPAILILQQIKKYLIIKRDRCNLAIQASELSSISKPVSDILIDMDFIYNKMKELNKKGP